MTTSEPGGASSMTLPVDAFAYEVLHGARLTGVLFDEVWAAATPALRKRYPDLVKALCAANDAIEDLRAVAAAVWRTEAKRAEAGDAP